MATAGIVDARAGTSLLLVDGEEARPLLALGMGESVLPAAPALRSLRLMVIRWPILPSVAWGGWGWAAAVPAGCRGGPAELAGALAWVPWSVLWVALRFAGWIWGALQAPRGGAGRPPGVCVGVGHAAGV